MTNRKVTHIKVNGRGCRGTKRNPGPLLALLLMCEILYIGALTFMDAPREFFRTMSENDKFEVSLNGLVQMAMSAGDRSGRP